MKKTYSYTQKIIQFFAVLLPIFITQLAIVSTGFFDTVMSGHVSEYDLAGVAIGANVFFPFFGSSLGIISGLTPSIAHLYGARKYSIIKFVIQQGFYWSLLLGLIFILAGFILIPYLLPLLKLDDYVSYVFTHYLIAMAFGICPIFLAGVLRNFIDALGFTKLTMFITIITVPINIFLNYVFIYGEFGMPAFGGIGAGIGSAITYYVNLLLNILVIINIKPFCMYKIFTNFPRPSFYEWKKQLSIGVPIGCTLFCEQSIFGVVGLLMTVYGTSVIAAHQAALNFTTLVYMIPLSISMAVTILISYELGAKRYNDVKQYAHLSRLFSLIFASGLAAILINFRRSIAALYTSNPDVIELTTIFLIYAVIMQVVDGINAPLQGILRGYKDVKITFYLAVLSFWLIGLPCGWLLAKYSTWGPYGYWLGLIAGLLSGAILLMLRLKIVEKKYV
ncbi:MATE family efflux transporter [Pectinatus brassicae]|uniref:Probable multidrug resistance protein NorM n=1 Tax=Pectinatus brassicae TaxID=862415 RepID=A0A840US79_9FIRM|nr:MATE family efflux transporter [Pectinatus brassicae]MBB5337002.1 MATE family multidrug resistance protein [Pectinatus brassicae]